MGWQEDEIVGEAPAEPSVLPPVVRGMERFGEAVTDFLPAIGGIAGAALGGPVGAGVLAAGGEAYRRLLKPEEGAPDPVGTAEDIALAGGLGLAGGGAAKYAPGAAGKLLKFATSPTGGAVIGGVDAARRGGGPVEIASEAALVGLGAKQLGGKVGAIRGAAKVAEELYPKASKAAVAKVEHAAKQIEKAIAEAPKPQMPKTAARPLAMTPKPAAQRLDLEAAEARIVQLHGDSLSPGQIAEQMRVELAGGAPDVGVKRVRTFVDTVLEKHGIKPHAGYRGTKPNAPPPALSANVGDEFMGQVTAMRRLGVDDTDIAKSLARKYKHYFEGMDDKTAFQMVKMVP